jgi:hypothetical protein
LPFEFGGDVVEDVELGNRRAQKFVFRGMTTAGVP